MTSNSTHHQHETARRAALIALARYGYLRASDLALLVYFDRLSGVRLAQRLLAKLHGEQWILRREGVQDKSTTTRSVSVVRLKQAVSRGFTTQVGRICCARSAHIATAPTGSVPWRKRPATKS